MCVSVRVRERVCVPVSECVSMCVSVCVVCAHVCASGLLSTKYPLTFSGLCFFEVIIRELCPFHSHFWALQLEREIDQGVVRNHQENMNDHFY